ncbi:MAG: hypothetical protein QG622_1824 [Actinomycetota bacterium]|nr:hypothetical protein [Actinomycetota bacterium]
MSSTDATACGCVDASESGRALGRCVRCGGSLPKVPLPGGFWEHETMLRALQQRHMGRVIREYRLHASRGRMFITQEEMALAAGITQAQLSRIETGPPMVHIDKLGHWADLLSVPPSRLWFRLPVSVEPPARVDETEFPGSVSFRGCWLEAFDQAADEWSLDVERRQFLRSAAYSATTTAIPALQWFIGQPETTASDTGTFTVGRAHVVNIREMTRTFRSLDNRFGGGHAREYILRFLSDEVAPLLHAGRYDSATGELLLSATSEAMLLAGWMSYDAGLHGLGQRYMTQALRLALACDDRLLGAEILSGLSHQATYVRDNNGGIDLARAAGKTARERGHDALLAEAFVMEAHAHARAGDERACSRALTAAETTLDRADRQADPQWIGYFDEAYLAAKFGHCFKELRKPGPAKHFAQRSLDMNDAYIRGRAFNLALLANAHAQADEVETACAVGSQALDIIGGLRSARALDYIRDLLNELDRFKDSPAVAALKESAGGVLSVAGQRPQQCDHGR